MRVMAYAKDLREIALERPAEALINVILPVNTFYRADITMIVFHPLDDPGEDPVVDRDVPKPAWRLGFRYVEIMFFQVDVIRNQIQELI